MSDINKQDDFIALRAALENDLITRYGPVLTGDVLIQALGYISKDAFRQSVIRRTVGVQLFELDNRRGKYALTKEVENYLAQKRCFSKV